MKMKIFFLQVLGILVGMVLAEGDSVSKDTKATLYISGLINGLLPERVDGDSRLVNECASNQTEIQYFLTMMDISATYFISVLDYYDDTSQIVSGILSAGEAYELFQPIMNASIGECQKFIAGDLNLIESWIKPRFKDNRELVKVKLTNFTGQHLDVVKNHFIYPIQKAYDISDYKTIGQKIGQLI